MERKLIGKGRTAEVFEWSDSKVLKLFVKDMPKDAIETEFNVTKKLNGSHLSVPIAYELVEEDDRLGILYEMIKGKSLTNQLSKSPWMTKVYGKMMARVHFETQIEIKENLALMKDNLKRNIMRVDILDDNVKSELLNRVDELTDGNRLCHADFHPDNLLIQGNKIYVIDWMTAVKGDPLSDVARTSIIIKFSSLPDHISWIEKKAIQIVRGRFYKAYMKEYMKLAHVTYDEIKKWEVPLAAARLLEWLPQDEKERLKTYILNEINS